MTCPRQIRHAWKVGSIAPHIGPAIKIATKKAREKISAGFNFNDSSRLSDFLQLDQAGLFSHGLGQQLDQRIDGINVRRWRFSQTS